MSGVMAISKTVRLWGFEIIWDLLLWKNHCVSDTDILFSILNKIITLFIIK